MTWKDRYNYRVPITGTRRCHTCDAFRDSDSHCLMFDAKVKKEAVCTEWTDDFTPKHKSDVKPGSVSHVAATETELAPMCPLCKSTLFGTAEDDLGKFYQCYNCHHQFLEDAEPLDGQERFYDMGLAREARRRPYVPEKGHVLSKAPESDPKTILAHLRVIPPPRPGRPLESVTERLSWEESEHPRNPQGKFSVKQDQHEVEVRNEKGKVSHTIKRCRHCGTLYHKTPKETNVKCPTCGENPERALKLTFREAADPAAAIADSLGWRFWKTAPGTHHRMYQWEGPNNLGQQVMHTVTGFGDHNQSQDVDARKTRKLMRSCMNGTCAHTALLDSPLVDTPGAPVLRAGQTVQYGAGQWWIMDVDGNLAHIYNDQGQEDIVPATELRAAHTTWYTKENDEESWKEDLGSRGTEEEVQARRSHAQDHEGAQGSVKVAQDDPFVWPDSEHVLAHAQDPDVVDNFQGVRDPNMIDSALGATQNQYYYGGVSDPFLLAAHMINNLQRQQALVEGNKRTATATGVSFLKNNGYPDADLRLDSQWQEFTNLIVGMAEGTVTPEQLGVWMRNVIVPHMSASYDRQERNRKFLEDIEEKWEDVLPDRDPDFAFVYFQGKLKVEVWDENLRVRQMAEQILQEQGWHGLEDYESPFEEDSTTQWVTGNVWRDPLEFEITQLADPDLIDAAEEAVREYFAV